MLLGRWQTVLIAEPYRYCFHSEMKNGESKFCCVGCKNKNKTTWARCKNVGTDAVTGQPIFEMLWKDDNHVCKAQQSTRWMNLVFLNRCFKAIRENPLGNISNIYDKTLLDMKQEYFSQAAADAKRTKVLQIEFAQNLRSYANIQSSLYRYRWNFVPKDPPVSIEINYIMKLNMYTNWNFNYRIPIARNLY